MMYIYNARMRALSVILFMKKHHYNGAESIYGVKTWDICEKLKQVID